MVASARGSIDELRRIKMLKQIVIRFNKYIERRANTGRRAGLLDHWVEI